MVPSSALVETADAPAPPDGEQEQEQQGQREQPQGAERSGQAQVRWLDDEEQRTWRAFLSATQLLMDRVSRQLQHDSDVVFTYYEMLVRLSEAPERSLRMSELADSSLSSRSRVSHAVARMEERGWIRRDACATDGRGFVAVLTDAGFEALREAAPSQVETVRSTLFDQLSRQQQEQLREISETLLAHLTSTGSVSPVPPVAPRG